MTLVVLGIDALDPEIVDPATHGNLSLDSARPIETISSADGGPSTHELWPTIITGLRPADHGVTLDDGVAWESPWLRYCSAVADHLLPDALQTAVGAALLNRSERDAFRVPATYYADHGIETVFDGRAAAAIGIPNYVTEPGGEDREHSLRRRMGELFERDPDARGGHVSADPEAFYEQCLEMVMVRVARTRRALRSGRYELVFGYTSGLDLVGHVAYQSPGMQEAAYGEVDDVVGELRGDLAEGDELMVVSDHGLQDGLHTDEAMVAATADRLCEPVESVTDVRRTVETELRERDHGPRPRRTGRAVSREGSDEVRQQLEELWYI